MDNNKTIIDQLSSPPSRQINALPIVTKNKVLPFEKLAWEDFERFCFQLGSKIMECLDTSYIYGRKGQKQDGIDLYFRQGTKTKVWQIKRYAEFKRGDISNAVEAFLGGKWAMSAAEFTLCVSNCLDDTGVVDEIEKQSSVLARKGVTFSVLNSEKLTIKAKEFPDLIDTFFGKHWLDALGITQIQKPASRSVPHWITDSGIVLDPEQIYHHGDYSLKFDGDEVYIDVQLRDGTNTYVIYNTKSNSVRVEKYPYPLHQYRIDIPEKLVLRCEEGTALISGKKYYVKRYHLKWGKNATFIFDSDDHEKLIDMNIATRTIIDNTKKIIHILDPASGATEL